MWAQCRQYGFLNQRKDKTHFWQYLLVHKFRYYQKIRKIDLCKKYDSKLYPKHDNYNAINVDKTRDIPVDYKEANGVPITFVDKYNPDQFEIIGMDQSIMKELTGKSTRFILDGKELYARIIIKHKK